MSFPSGPVNGQTANVGGITYTYIETKTAWSKTATTSADLAANSLSLISNVSSVSTTSGALIVVGGAGVGGNLNVGRTMTATSIIIGAGGVVGNLNISGTMTATSIVESSSILLKENVKPIDNALTLITQLQGVTYDRRDSNVCNEAGLIAEEVSTILPNLVAFDSQGNPVGIQYTKLTAYLIEAVKSLKSEVDRLKNNN